MIEIIETENHIILKPGKNIMATTVTELKSEIHSLIQKTPRDVIFDLTGVTLVDSIGIEVFISVHDFLKKNGYKIKVTNAAKEIYELFTFLRLDRHFSVEKKI